MFGARAAGFESGSFFSFLDEGFEVVPSIAALNPFELTEGDAVVFFDDAVADADADNFFDDAVADDDDDFFDDLSSWLLLMCLRSENFELDSGQRKIALQGITSRD